VAAVQVDTRTLEETVKLALSSFDMGIAHPQFPQAPFHLQAYIQLVKVLDLPHLLLLQERSRLLHTNGKTTLVEHTQIFLGQPLRHT
jgi:hypothetical protein